LRGWIEAIAESIHYTAGYSKDAIESTCEDPPASLRIQNSHVSAEHRSHFERGDLRKQRTKVSLVKRRVSIKKGRRLTEEDLSDEVD
jgi:hypothetical protein